jgi:DNA primase small subunit
VNLKSAAFVQEKFRYYYSKEFSLSNALSMIEKREFGFASFEGWMLRHKSFRNEEELTTFLRDFVPKDAYYSCAMYETPEAEMEKKDWLGADLIFDIDADHVPTSCEKIHDEWTCGNCGFSGKGVMPANCPVCGSEKLDTSTWPCETCLNSAKTETIKLLDMLMQDFGFSKNELHVFFSGHRGYHVHIESEIVRTLDAMARKEIVDYVSGLGLDITIHGGNKKSWKPAPTLGNLGWSRRIGKGIHDFISNTKEEELVSLGLKRKIAETLLKNKESILRDWNDSGIVSTIKGVGPETWNRIMELCIRNQSAKIDTVVTTDTHRLIRLADALHGKTGFRKVCFPISEIDDFDPFKSAVAFKTGSVSVLVSDAPEFRLGDKHFGPYKKQKIELPTAAAILLLCRDRAEVIEQNVQRAV